jgi:hypothetical protein
LDFSILRPGAGCIKQVGYDNFFLFPFLASWSAHIIHDAAVFHSWNIQIILSIGSG